MERRGLAIEVRKLLGAHVLGRDPDDLEKTLRIDVVVGAHGLHGRVVSIEGVGHRLEGVLRRLEVDVPLIHTHRDGAGGQAR